MVDEIPQSLIILTYKGKVLLMHKRTSLKDDVKHLWCFIGGNKEKAETFENAMSRRVEIEMGIKIDKIEFVSESCYHSALTDDNVNKINRAEGQMINFFSLKELNKLFLANSTRQFVIKHGNLI